MAQYYFFFIVSHNDISRFSSKYIELKPSYWRELFAENFANVRVLNLALSCNDAILELIPTYCPSLEYLNASSKYVIRHLPPNKQYCNGSPMQLAVSDVGLRHLGSCKNLRVLIVNEPRNKHHVTINNITLDGLRYLLRNVPTIEELSYSDIGNLITTNFDGVDSLNLTVIKHLEPTVKTLRRIFNLCKKIKKLELNGSVDTNGDAVSTQLVREMCAASDQKFREIEFQNIYFGDYFERFFQQFGENLTSISLDLPRFSTIKMTYKHIVIIGLNCVNLEFLLCYNISSDDVDAEVDEVRWNQLRPFSELRSLYISGANLQLKKLLTTFTQFAHHLGVLKIDERERFYVVDELILKQVDAPCLRHLEIPRLICTRSGIESMLAKYPKLNFLILKCADDCHDLIASMKAQNYDIVMIINKRFAF